MSASIATSPAFEDCHPHTARWEGGWSNHPADPGGKTMFGVTEVVFHEWLKANNQPIRAVRTITMNEALTIYYNRYWRAARCQRLVPGVDLATYDLAVNSGPARAIKVLEASLDPNNRHDVTVMRICASRLSFLQGLKNWKTFGRGWSNRVADIQAVAVKRALVAMGHQSTLDARLAAEAKAKKTVSNAQTTGGITGAAGTGGTGVVLDSAPPEPPTDGLLSAAQSGPDWLLIFILAGLAILTVWLFWRAHLNRQQSRAFALQVGDMRHA